MSKSQKLRALVNVRLTAAAEEIFALFERTIAEYEEELRRSKEENRRKQGLLEALNPRTVLLFRADLKTIPASPGPGVSQGPNQGLNQRLSQGPNQGLNQGLNQGPNQGLNKGLNQGVNQKPAKTSVIKEEPEEQHVKQEEDQLNVTVPESSPVFVKSEESSQLQQTEPREETQGEDVNAEPQLHPETEGDTDTDNDEDWRAPFSCSGAHMETEAEEPGTSVTANNRNMTGTAERADKTTEHACSFCKKIFRSKHHLKIHTRVHTGEKPCSCSVCGKRFAVGSTLKLHMRTHTGDRPFSCSFCGKAFSQKSHLNGHVRIHTGVRPFRCSICEKNFAQRSHLKRHMTTHSERDQTI